MRSSPILVSAAEGYALWAAAWDRERSPVVSVEERTLGPLIGALAGRMAVDVSCGTGRWMRYARQRGARVAGVDASGPMLRRAQAKEGLDGRLALADARRLPFRAGAADVALCALSLGHIPGPAQVIRDLAVLLRPGGRLLVSDFHPEAARRGWRRTFRRGGQVFEVANEPYEISELLQAAAGAGLALEASIDACFGEPEREAFRRAGREAEFEQSREVPVVWAAAWKRAG